jgi:hypothetical protein
VYQQDAISLLKFSSDREEGTIIMKQSLLAPGILSTSGVSASESTLEACQLLNA